MSHEGRKLFWKARIDPNSTPPPPKSVGTYACSLSISPEFPYIYLEKKIHVPPILGIHVGIITIGLKKKTPSFPGFLRKSSQDTLQPKRNALTNWAI